MKKDRFRRIVITVILFFLLVIVTTLCGLYQIMAVHGQVLPVIKMTEQQQVLEMPVCSEESLVGRPPHPPELTSCSELITWQNQLADNLGIPVVTRDVRNRRGRLIKRGNFSQLVSAGKLVRFQSTKYLSVKMRKRSFPYVAAQVKAELEVISEEYYTERNKKLETVISLLRFHETREEGSMHRRGLAADVTCINMTAEDVAVFKKILIAHVQKNRRIQPAEESDIGAWKKHGINKPIAYHIVVFNASFLELYSRPAN